MMLTLARRTAIVGAIFLACLAAAGTGGAEEMTKTTVEGLVRDISCAIQNPRATATFLNLKCALQCARNGSPLIILSKDGILYVPMSNAMPDHDVRQQLMPFVGKYVKAKGKVYERSGTRVIAIDEIVAMKDVHVVTDAQ